MQILNVDSSLVVLCSDGSLWCLRQEEEGWRRVKGIPGSKAVIDEEQTMSIKRLNLSARAINGLMSQEVYTVSQLLDLTHEDLRKIPSLGRKSIFEIKTALEGMDKSLRDDVVK